jgi:transcriptional regulator with XRE-family HTH domain
LPFNLQDIKNYIIFAHKNRNDMWTELSDPAILQKMGRRIRDYRMRMEMTQSELAEKSGVSMGTIVRVEQGNPISTLLLISILRTMGILENLEVLLPELSISPLQMRKLQGKKVQRIRHKKED